jgi:cation diffusion facilitator family transporter
MKTKASPSDASGHGYSENEIRQMAFAMRWSLAIGFLMLLMKTYAYYITGSAAILSDAAESIVHVLAVSFAAYSLRLSTKPPDENHMYGHDRISFFSAGFEGAMIIIAAVYIIYESIHKWMSGLAIESLGTGTLFTVAATAVNGALGWYLVRQGKKFHSIVLVANGKHVLTDSWTSLGVIVGLILILLTGWLPFDPILAIVVAINILWTGGRLMRQSIGGLMDESDPEMDAKLRAILDREAQKFSLSYHHLRHRNAGMRLLIEFHLLFHEKVTIAQAHEQATRIEQEIRKGFPNPTEILSHLEPLEGHDEIHHEVMKG